MCSFLCINSQLLLLQVSMGNIFCKESQMHSQEKTRAYEKNHIAHEKNHIAHEKNHRAHEKNYIELMKRTI